MMDSEASFGGWLDGAEYVLCRRGKKPWSQLTAFEFVEPAMAHQIVLRAAEAMGGGPNWRLLHFLGVHDHPSNRNSADFRCDLERVLDGPHAPDLYRRVREVMAVSGAAMLDAPRAARALPVTQPARHLDFIGFQVLDQDGAPVVGALVELAFADGEHRTMCTAADGRVYVDGVAAGLCNVTILKLRGEA